MKVIAATVVVDQPSIGEGSDHVVLHTDLKDPINNCSCLDLAVTASKDHGADWVRKTFNIEPFVISYTVWCDFRSGTMVYN